MGDRVTDPYEKLMCDLRDARTTAQAAADKVPDSGSANLDGVRLSTGRDQPIRRWSARIQRAAGQVGCSVSRGKHGSHLVGFGYFGQAWKNTAAVEAAAALLRERGWQAYVMYILD